MPQSRHVLSLKDELDADNKLGCSQHHAAAGRG
jgi:hypothetical protein